MELEKSLSTCKLITVENKNIATIQYSIWQVVQYFRQTQENISTLNCINNLEIADVVKTSTSDGKNIPQLIKSPGGEVEVKFYQWTSFLGQFFRTIPKILN